MLPDFLNHLFETHGRTDRLAPSAEIHLRLERDWDCVPRAGEGMTVHPEADLKEIDSVWWNANGTVDLWLEDFDTDEVDGDEGAVIEELFEAGWEIDWEMMPVIQQDS